MAAFKVSSSLQQSSLSEEDCQILKQAKQVASDVARLNNGLVEKINPIDAVAQCVEEIVMLQEFRISKYNRRMSEIGLIKKQMAKTLKR